MANPRYEKSTGFLIIEWYEKKKDKATATRHYFEQKPKKLQLHPMDTEKIVRIHFSGKMPGWVKDYCEKVEHKFSYKEVNHGSDIGWMLLNWRSYQVSEQPLIAPNIIGAVKRLASKIDNVCSDWRQSLLDNVDIVNKNLCNYHELFESIGIRYRPEEVHGVEGCLVIDHTIFLERKADETDVEYRSRFENDGRLNRVIQELVNPLPDPVVDETNTEETDTTLSSELISDDDLDTSSMLQEAEEDELGLSGTILFEEDELDLSGTILFEEDELDLSGTIFFEEDEFDLTGTLEVGDDLDNDQTLEVEMQKDTSILESGTEMLGDSTNEQSAETTENKEIDFSVATTATVKSDSVQKKPEYFVLDYSHKASGAIQGQLSIF